MDFSEEWKSLFPVSLVDSSPLLLSEDSLGPLCFNPISETLTQVVSSPSHLSPHLLLPPPNISLPRFLATSTLFDSGAAIPRTTSNAISALFGPHYHHGSSDGLFYNRIESLCCPNSWVLVFFPTGSNLDRVGFIVLRVRDSTVAVVDFRSHDPFFTSPIKFDHQIVRLAASPLSGCDIADVGSSGSIGFLMACTMYAAHWFSVRISGLGSEYEKPVLVYLGSKLFKSCAVAYSCWNPHLPEECVVLLETGALFLFDMNSSCFKGKRMSVAWDELGESSGDGWFSCEFSWHPRILVVANLKAVFVLDFRFEKCQPCCLLKVEMLGMYDVVERDQFLSFSKAGVDGFFFAVASKHWLVLCDVRSPLIPVLRWVHNLHEPCYMTVLPLNELRPGSLDEEHAGASEMGSAVILGSFWHDEFNLFCYGRPSPSTIKPFSIKRSKFCNSVYAWGQPSQLFLSGRCCGCGSCLLKEESMKDDFPEWIRWQQKKDLVLGFFILKRDISLSLPRSGQHGGFTLVRLMSSGALETQQFCASWEVTRMVDIAHQETPCSKDSLLCDIGEEEYKFTKRFKYVKLEYLYSHLNDNLPESVFSKLKNPASIANTKDCSDERFRDFMSDKLKSLFSCDPPISDLSASDVFRDISMPTSLYEIGDKLMWIGLPMNTIELAYLSHDQLDEEKLSLTFPIIPNHHQAPPFFLRTSSHLGNKRTSKIVHGNDFVGPVVPLSALLVLSEISKYGHSFLSHVNEYSPEEATTRKCRSVMCVAKEMGIPNCSNKQVQDHAVSLGDDKEETWGASLNSDSLFWYEPSACVVGSDDGNAPKDSFQEGQTFNRIFAKVKSDREKGTELFDDLCPVDLRFECGDDKVPEGEELNAYRFLKKQFLQWQDGFIPYQNFCDRLKSK